VGTSILRALSLSLCTLLGWHFVFTRIITLGQYIAFMAYINFLYSPLQTVVEALSSMQEAAVSLERPLQFLSRPREAHIWQTCVFPATISAPITQVSLKDLRFGYSNDKIVFDLLNVTLRRGTTAIIGRSGSGKTTFLQLLSGLHAPHRGEVKFNGTDVRHIPLEEIRAQVSAVWQDSWILPGSLWENLVMDQVITKREVDRIIEVCQMSALLSRLPDGYETKLGAGGVVLSAGQRQLLSIARALLRRTPILLLDEATANIDLAIEAHLLPALLNECRDRVTVITTHRSAPAMLTDQVFACRGGSLHDITAKLRAPLPSSRNGNSTDERVRALLHEHTDVLENHYEARSIEVQS
jgi:ABC-type bacteriocin/lantibiotic exporter with double-glycine peptidase domain